MHVYISMPRYMHTHAYACRYKYVLKSPGVKFRNHPYFVEGSLR